MQEFSLYNNYVIQGQKALLAELTAAVQNCLEVQVAMVRKGSLNIWSPPPAHTFSFAWCGYLQDLDSVGHQLTWVSSSACGDESQGSSFPWNRSLTADDWIQCWCGDRVDYSGWFYRQGNCCEDIRCNPALLTWVQPLLNLVVFLREELLG